MRAALLLILMFSSSYLKGQGNYPMLKKAVESGHLGKVIVYLHSPAERRKDCMDNGREVRLHREVIPGYFETIVDIFSCIPVDASSYYNLFYRLDILSRDSTIFYYKLRNKFQKNVLWADKDQTSMQEFQKKYMDFYGVPLRQKELFVDTVIFGTHCGEDPIPIPDFVRLTKLISNKDTTSLQHWLRSPNTETQLLAIYGFYELKKLGYSIDEKILWLIRYILNKEGDVQSCGGCDFDNRTIKDVKDDFEF